IQQPHGVPVDAARVLVSAAAPEKWFESSRAVKATRPDQQGQWRIKGLPAGDYLAIALEYVEDGSWNDPEYLESLRDAAAKLTLADGEPRAVPLKVTIPK